ncbi:DER1-domain-containing protein [Cantharellus anzutake]|uniref:DER1-domain-containing protein n=1 Tax=Cantharellus anzutake TaxID=1750568 RepID=UPI00190900A8|nr:DER1-domain-containing protein [Cantharellus anzutake]KAF8324284.1 DER1-domain-containing protein [Cantharellus anzutake]
MSGFFDEIRKIPPVTRFLLASTLAVSLPLMSGLVSPYPFLFDWNLVRDRLQLWRGYTSFFFAGSGIDFIFNVAMLYRNSNALEEGQYARRSADYAWHLLISAVSIIALNIPLRSSVHFRPLFVAITTIASAFNPEQPTSLWGLITFPQKYFPIALVALDFILAGPQAAAASVTGIITGYVLWMLEWKETPGRVFGRTPGWLRAIVGDGAVIPPSGATRGGYTVRPPRTRDVPASSTTTGYDWGSGRRLGNE